MRVCEINSSADTQVSAEGGTGSATGARAETPSQPGVQTVVCSSAPSAQGGPWWSRDPPAACGGPHTGAGGCLKEAGTPWEAGSCQDLWTGGEEKVCWQDLWSCEEHKLEQSVPDRLPPMGMTHTGEVHKRLSPAGGTSWRRRGRVWGVPSEEKGAAEVMCDELTAACISQPLHRGGRENWE